jgi:hypothetical protein
MRRITPPLTSAASIVSIGLMGALWRGVVSMASAGARALPGALVEVEASALSRHCRGIVSHPSRTLVLRRPSAQPGRRLRFARHVRRPSASSPRGFRPRPNPPFSPGVASPPPVRAPGAGAGRDLAGATIAASRVEACRRPPLGREVEALAGAVEALAGAVVSVLVSTKAETGGARARRRLALRRVFGSIGRRRAGAARGAGGRLDRGPAHVGAEQAFASSKDCGAALGLARRRGQALASWRLIFRNASVMRPA